MADPIDPHKTQPTLKREPVFFSRYLLIAEIGRGGMGVVWQAEDTKLRRKVALKFLPDLVVRDREAMADLATETRRCLELTHPHIVRVYDLVEDGTRAAISMELVAGGSLAERKLAQPDRCFSSDALAPWLAQLCSALDYAHAKGHVVHRDLKPLNLLVNTDGDLKVVDFGIARSLLKSGTRLSLDSRSTAVSLAYVGPQQLLGESPAVTDDIYSLGATIYELLTGKTPFFEGDIITQLREVVPPSMAARRAELCVNPREPIPRSWEETVAACLAKQAADRPRSAGEVAARLGVAAAGTAKPANHELPAVCGERSSGGPAAGISAAMQPKKKRLLWLGLGALAGLTALAALIWRRSPAEEGRPGRIAPATMPAGTRTPKANTPASTPPPAVPVPVPEFVVTVDPPDVAARLWLAQQSDVAVPADGQLRLKDVPDGEHELVVQAPGYQTTTRRVAVKEHRGNADIKLVPVPGVVVVVARPGTVVTAVDARGRVKPVGTIPPGGSLRSDNALTIGTYRFNLAHPDCQDTQQADVSLAIGRVARVAPGQTALPGELRVFSEPTGAEVSVNGTNVGVTPATLPAQPSEKALNVEVFLRGYRRIRQSATLKPGETRTLNVGTLVAESGTIEFRQGTAEFRPPKAVVRIDGHGVILVKGQVGGLEVGARVVSISHPDYEPWQQTVTVRDRQPVQVDVKLVPKPAVLTLAITGPTNYALLANGKPIAVKNGRATVPAEEKLALEIAAHGFRTARLTRTLPAKGAETLALTLEKIPVAEFGQPWTVPELGLTVMPVAAGTFAMGSKNGEASERPVTQVTITKPFWLGRTEVTQREWTALMGSNPSHFKGDLLPVENVSWTLAMEFCRKLTERERAADRLPAAYAYTLPTEAQWEYACRAGSTGDFAGDIADMAWHEGNSGNTTHAVGAKKPNVWGLYDMHGNVWEWCSDSYADKLKGGSVTDPKTTSGASRVRRGGSWVINALYCRSAFRGKGEPDFLNSSLGFRVALVPAP